MVILLILFSVLCMMAYKSISKTARECDEYYGHVCSIYEIDQYGKGVRK